MEAKCGLQLPPAGRCMVPRSYELRQGCCRWRQTDRSQMPAGVATAILSTFAATELPQYEREPLTPPPPILAPYSHPHQPCS
jgi:hypothetical protein